MPCSIVVFDTDLWLQILIYAFVRDSLTVVVVVSDLWVVVVFDVAST